MERSKNKFVTIYPFHKSFQVEERIVLNSPVSFKRDHHLRSHTHNDLINSISRSQPKYPKRKRKTFLFGHLWCGTYALFKDGIHISLKPTRILS